MQRIEQKDSRNCCGMAENMPRCGISRLRDMPTAAWNPGKDRGGNAGRRRRKSMETWVPNNELIIDSSSGALLYWNHAGEGKERI